jgi:MCP family monocarboxylic acid transporter-like MFS transporter 2
VNYLSPLSFPPPGRFYDFYGDYQWTYLCCGIILIISSVFLFVGMGINYKLLEREKEEEERRETERPKEECTAMLEGEKEERRETERPKEECTAMLEGEKERAEESSEVTPMTDVSKMDEDIV